MNKYQTFLPRLFALALDAILLLPLSVLSDWIAGNELQEGVKAGLSTAIDFLNVFYFIVMHAVYGQTVGKMLMKVRVLDVSETKLRFRQALMRDIPQLIFVSASLVPFMNTDLGVRDVPVNPVAIVVMIWGLADIAMFLVNSKRRALHDLIAGSVVVRLEDKPASYV